MRIGAWMSRHRDGEAAAAGSFTLTNCSQAPGVIPASPTFVGSLNHTRQISSTYEDDSLQKSLKVRDIACASPAVLNIPWLRAEATSRAPPCPPTMTVGNRRGWERQHTKERRGEKAFRDQAADQMASVRGHDVGKLEPCSNVSCHLQHDTHAYFSHKSERLLFIHGTARVI